VAASAHLRRLINRNRLRRGSAFAFMLCAGLVLVSCAGMDSQSAQPGPGPSPQIMAQVVLCDSSLASCTSQSNFSLRFVRDLNVMVNWENLTPGTHAQRVSFLYPTGDVYKAYEQSFMVAEGGNGSATTLQALPVAGTWITQRRLMGGWSVTVELDGQTIGSRPFEFTP